jgi:hypothetical protein
MLNIVDLAEHYYLGIVQNSMTMTMMTMQYDAMMTMKEGERGNGSREGKAMMLDFIT